MVAVVRPRRILLVDFLDRYQEVLAALLNRAGRAIGKPDFVVMNGVAKPSGPCARRCRRQQAIGRDSAPAACRKLKLEVNGLDAGKFLIVQLPSIWICDGGVGLTKPSITPPRSATQSSASAWTASRGNNTKAENRILIQNLPHVLALFLSPQITYALVPLNKRYRRRSKGPR